MTLTNEGKGNIVFLTGVITSNLSFLEATFEKNYLKIFRTYGVLVLLHQIFAAYHSDLSVAINIPINKQRSVSFSRKFEKMVIVSRLKQITNTKMIAMDICSTFLFLLFRCC